MKLRTLTQRLQAISVGLLATSFWVGPTSHFVGCSSAWAQENDRVTPIVRAIRKAEPAVVNIQGNKTVTNTGTNGVSTVQEVNGMGTGVIIDRRGLIITNYHVVDAVQKIEVTLADGTTTIANLINYDPETDLAMIKINVDKDLPVIHVGRSDNLLRGESVIAIGNPFGYQNTVTVGIISALHRDIPVNGSQQYTDLIQTNADINPGNSGGPLLNIDGEVIGINVAVRVGAQGIGFAIPIDNAISVMSELVAQYRTTGSHGLVCSRISTDNGMQLVLDEYRSNSSKESSREFKPGDEIVSIGGQKVETPLDIELALLGLPAGETIELELQRGGETLVHNVVLPRKTSVSDESDILRMAWDKLGIRVVPVPAAQVEPIGKDYEGGLKIVEVRPNSPAARQALSTGDIIVGVMDWKTPNLKHLAWVMANNSFQTASAAQFHLLRRNQFLKVAMTPDRTKR
ncbi:Putative serine protease HhoB precursor [Pirellula sp. SH-Sr6A]|uniref:trypsin-like peptidase domain-containing protein n=1 Tax=Pirellula sp. SH-Sr6A TaxID=1632865 RepID=UPI00078CCB4B|nr:trypsin-like peptidase domain-containing protein [Pirellula sp. SH-Sr6A]AMV34123.1 Putative serine protease HhoB precursor [Pirellula sp. SH-Sr6A]